MNEKDEGMHWLIRIWVTEDHTHDSPCLTSPGMLLGQLDGIVLHRQALGVQVWEHTTTGDTCFHSWTDEPVEITDEVLARCAERSMKWLTMLDQITDEMVLEAAHEMYGTSLAGVCLD